MSEPDIRSPEEAGAYLRELRATRVARRQRRAHGRGSLRCDANISMLPVGTEVLGTKVEIKNMNSVRSLERALVYEISRQTKALEAGETIVQETRHGTRTPARPRRCSKEEAFDYRYPEPDVPAIEPSAGGSRSCGWRCPSCRGARRERPDR